MQVTLVSHYGRKPDDFADLIRACQGLLSGSLHRAFRPYQLGQVHGTIIGLEGEQDGGTIRNRNSGKQVDPAVLLAFLREQLPDMEIRIGGYRRSADYGFKSRGAHPFARSFSIRGSFAVAMGWPVASASFPNSIDELRWRFGRELGLRHKWHEVEGDLDNDFYFVLGRVEPGVGTSALRRATNEVRTYLSGLEGVGVRIRRESTWVVAYVDDQLPLETSHALRVDDPHLTPERLLALYTAVD